MQNEYFQAMKNNEITLLAEQWMECKIIISETSEVK
jgi:hypothetical protein